MSEFAKVLNINTDNISAPQEEKSHNPARGVLQGKYGNKNLHLPPTKIHTHLKTNEASNAEDFLSTEIVQEET